MTDDWDAETKRIVRGYFGRDPRQPCEVIHTHFESWSSNEWTLDEFKAILDGVPVEVRSKTRVEFDSGGYDDSSFLKITYPRMETPEEVAENVRRGLEYAEGRKRKEIETYQSLKAKFEGKKTRLS